MIILLKDDPKRFKHIIKYKENKETEVSETFLILSQWLG